MQKKFPLSWFPHIHARKGRLFVCVISTHCHAAAADFTGNAFTSHILIIVTFLCCVCSIFLYV